MAITFATLAALATVAGGWIVRANQYGRVAAMILLAILGLTLIWDGLADRLTAPLVRLGSRLTPGQTGGEPGIPQALLLGVATGLLWAPCAGPILGLILTGAAVAALAHTGVSAARPAAAPRCDVSHCGASMGGGAERRHLSVRSARKSGIRRVLGVAVLAGVAAIALGLDRGVLTQLSLTSTSGVEQSLVNRLQRKQEAAQNDAPGMMTMSSNSPANG